MRPVAHIAVPALLCAMLARGAYAQQAPEDSVDRLIVGRMQRDHIPGVSVAIVRSGRVLKSRGYGLASIEQESPATAATVYELASVTKPIVATAILMLVDSGRVALDDPLTKYFPDGPEAWSTITVRNLLSHTAGFPDFYYAPQRLSAVLPLRYTVAQQLADVARITPRAAPGTRVEYSTAGYFLLSQIVARASGMTWRQFVQDRIIAPIGMTHTQPLNSDVVIPHRADGYTLRDGAIVPWRLAVEMQALDDEYTLVSTTGDLVLFAEALRTNKLLKPDTRALMETPATLADGSPARLSAGTLSGLGWFLHRDGARTFAVHAGHTGTALLRYLDGDGLTVVLLTNLGAGYPPPFGHDKGHAATDFAEDIARAAQSLR